MRRPIPRKENRQILERDDLGPPVVPGGHEIGLGSRNLRPRAEARPTGRRLQRAAGGLGWTDGDLSPPVSARRTTWPDREWGYSTRRHTLEPVRPEAVLPDRALCLPTFSHFLIVNKTSLSLSLSLLPSPRLLPPPPPPPPPPPLSWEHQLPEKR